MSGVSIVIPVGDADDRLDAQLAALATSTGLSGTDIDVVLAANRSVAPVARAASAAVWPAEWSVRVVDATDVAGPSHARNTGWRATRGDVVLFCDADDLVHPGWASTMARAARRHGICGGRLSYDVLNPAGLALRVTASRDALPRKFGHLPYTPSCSLAMRRELLEATGGFDETMQCGEDIDLCWRAAHEGASIVFVRDAVVEYRLRASARAAFRQAVRYATDDAALLRAHRSAGARWTLGDSVREWAAAAKSVAFVFAGLEARITAASRLGSCCGRVVGSIRHRILAL